MGKSITMREVLKMGYGLEDGRKAALKKVFDDNEFQIEPGDYLYNSLDLTLDYMGVKYTPAELLSNALTLALEGHIVAYHVNGCSQGDYTDLCYVGNKLWSKFITKQPELKERREWFKELTTGNQPQKEGPILLMINSAPQPEQPPQERTGPTPESGK